MDILWLCISVQLRPWVFNTNVHLVISWVVLLIPWLLVPELRGQRKFNQSNGLQFDFVVKYFGNCSQSVVGFLIERVCMIHLWPNKILACSIIYITLLTPCCQLWLKFWAKDPFLLPKPPRFCWWPPLPRNF